MASSKEMVERMLGQVSMLVLNGPFKAIKLSKERNFQSYMLIDSGYITFERTTLQRLRTDWRLRGTKAVVVVVLKI